MRNLILIAVAAQLLQAGLAFAQTAANYPAKPIRYIVGYTPAGTADMLARAVGQKLAEAWGQQVIVENRPGAGTNIATELIDVVAGHIEIYFGAMVSTIPHVKSGRLRALGVTSTKRVAASGDTPTLDEQGLKGFETGSWFGMAVPTGTPREIIMKLHAEANRAILAPSIRGPMSAEGAEFVGDGPEQFAAFVKAEIAKWGKAVKASGAKPE